MSQSSKMNDALKKNVIAPLQAMGFTGEFPHYRKVYDNRIELLVIEKINGETRLQLKYPQFTRSVKVKKETIMTVVKKALTT